MGGPRYPSDGAHGREVHVVLISNLHVAHLVPFMNNALRSSNYFCSFSAVFGGCGAKIHATSFCCSLWYFGFLSSQSFARG
jgi:hypothetical protein